MQSGTVTHQSAASVCSPPKPPHSLQAIIGLIHESRQRNQAFFRDAVEGILLSRWQT